MKTFSLFKFFFLTGLCTVFALACQKSSNVPANQPDQSPQKAMMKNVTNDMYMQRTLDYQDFGMINNFDNVTTASKGALTSCKVVTYVPAQYAYPYTKTMDYGTGCIDVDGKFKKGKLITTYYVNPATATPGSVLSFTTYKNFYIDTVNIRGGVKTTLMSNNPYTTKLVIVRNLFDNHGNDRAYASTDIFTQTAGQDTPGSADDVFTVTGSSTGLQILNGTTLASYSSTIDALHPLISMPTCSYTTQGIENADVKIFLPSFAEVQDKLDYGSGTCDNIATLSINGGTAQTITLPINFWPF